ncbi:hypothetical protein [Vibrio ostreicida]|uniref:hypothetical protein n=1 Tax=Vibrio ostreicida TaxID=526588 RepID=UPI0009706C0C|nr:hypothetical protein [Vibrio ostreicida]
MSQTGAFFRRFRQYSRDERHGKPLGQGSMLELTIDKGKRALTLSSAGKIEAEEHASLAPLKDVITALLVDFTLQSAL